MSAKILEVRSIWVGLILIVTIELQGINAAGPVLDDTLTSEHCPSAGSHCDSERHEDQDSASLNIPYSIPTLGDWEDASLAFSHGAEGEWDYHLWGGFANSLIKRGDTYYLYYQGSPSYDNQCGSVSQRAIGVAISTDGIHWVKSAKNPVITWASQGSIEEGAVSAAAWVGADGRIYLYYGANSGTGCTVHASARLAVSEDGESFQDLGEVLSGSDPSVWGSGDEIFPVGAYSYENQWYLYYIPNGVSLSRKLGVAIGSSAGTFTQSTGLNGSTIPAWGPVSIHLQGADSVLFTNPNDGSGAINIYRYHADNPSLVKLYDSYTIPNCMQSSVIYESSANQWLMSCRDEGAQNYYIRRAYRLHTFADVPQTHWAWSWIERLYNTGITAGCADDPFRYCSEGTVTRAQMAVFLLRGMHGSTYSPPEAGATTGFDDVPNDYWAGPWIKQLAAEGITTGCGNNNYCPESPVSRAEMAVFLLRSKHGQNYIPPLVGDGTGFDDVAATHWAAAWIKQLVAEGIATGCMTATYCPEEPVTRAQMAVFLVKTFALP